MSLTFSKPVNRLAWRAGSTGVSRDEAVARASANVEAIREQSLVIIDDNIALLIKDLAVDARPDPSVVRVGYESSNTIAGMAGVFGYPDLGKAAYSLCEMLNHFEQTNTWIGAAIRAHLDTMDILRKRPPNMHSDDSIDLIQNLAMMTNHIQGKA